MKTIVRPLESYYFPSKNRGWKHGNVCAQVYVTFLSVRF